MDFSKIDKYIEEQSEAMIDDLASLVSHPSVYGLDEDGINHHEGGEWGYVPQPGAPFGGAVAGALKEALAIADRMGFSTRDEGYYGIADYGDCEAAPEIHEGEYGGRHHFMAVLGHLDVVPVSPEDWKTNPFELTETDGSYYGRGAIDDKGPMLAAMYGAAALRAYGYEPVTPIRMIFGTNEETRVEDMASYKAHEKMPMGGFTPDASWPVIIGEKGIYHFTLSSSWNGDETDDDAYLKLVSIKSGTASNIVSARAEAVFDILEGAELSFPEAEGIEVGLKDDKILISATGKATHGSTPELGDNALVKLLRYLDGMRFGPAGAKTFVSKVTRLTMDDKTGGDMSLNARDKYSETTVSPNKLYVSESTGEMTVDMRFCVTSNVAHQKMLLRELASREEIDVSDANAMEPLFISEDSDLIKGLLAAFREVTRRQDPPLVIGGGTYAKFIPGMVAFGCEPGEGLGRCHEANEYISKDEIIEAAKIYARAIYNITCK